MPTITARTLITAIGSVAYPSITVGATGLIEDISTDASLRSDRVLTPVFCDVHLHGGAGYDVMTATPAGFSALQRSLAARGTGQYLPTTATAPVEDTLRALERIATAIEAASPANEARPLGVHLEGPFLSHVKRGVHAAELLQRPSIELFERFHQAARGHIRLLTLAPELPGALELTAYAVARGVRVSLGHTDADTAATVRAVRAGASSATHTFNAMRALSHRDAGVLGVVLTEGKLYAELICDGQHVSPEGVKLWQKMKGEHAMLVTDAISATGMGDGQYTLAGQPVTVVGGRCTLTESPATLAGSVLTLDRAVQNLRSFTGCALEYAVRCASSQPAAMLGLQENVASLREGQPASFNQYTAAGELEATYLYGQRV